MTSGIPNEFKPSSISRLSKMTKKQVQSNASSSVMTKSLQDIINGEECPIRQDGTILKPETIVTPSCLHSADKEAMQRWLLISPHQDCPSCRTPFHESFINHVNT